MFTFTDDEWVLFSRTHRESQAQSGIPWEQRPFTLEESRIYFGKEGKQQYSDDVLVKLFQQFTMEVSEFEDEGYYGACTGLDWGEAQALIARMRAYLAKAGYEV